ncbi:MAG: hypothetical protein WCL32_02130 [Planctomycetota bacterium]
MVLIEKLRFIEKFARTLETVAEVCERTVRSRQLLLNLAADQSDILAWLLTVRNLFGHASG